MKEKSDYGPRYNTPQNCSPSDKYVQVISAHYPSYENYFVMAWWINFGFIPIRFA